MRGRFNLLSGILLAATLVLPGQSEPENTLTFIDTAWTPSESCNDDIARTVLLADLLADPEATIGECVSVEGIARADALFLRKTDARRKSSTWIERLSERRIGLYGQEASMDSVFDANLKRIRLIGAVSNCESLSGSATMVMGYCHYTTGPILLLAEGSLAERE